MKTATILLRLEKSGHDVQKHDITPAEVALLVSEHKANVSGDPILELTPTADVTRTDIDEVLRLKKTYSAVKITALYPGLKPSLPVSFEEARALGLGVALPVNKLLVKA